MSKEALRVFYCCNAVDEATKKERDVRFDSPAATNKVLSIARALQSQGVDIHILSLGRGRQTGNGKKHPVQTIDIKGIPIHYAAFWHLPVLTHIVGAFSLSRLFRQFTKDYEGRIVVIAYNRLWHYLPTLLQAKSKQAEGYLDLEDGDIPPSHWVGRKKIWVSKRIFGYLCSSGALLAGNALAAQVSTTKTFVCYGCTDLKDGDEKKWSKRPVKILFGGSLLKETGVQLLIDSLSLFATRYPELTQKLSFTLTGQGWMSEALKCFSQEDGQGWVHFLGSVDHSAYVKELSKTHIGLCLKLSTSEMGKTTFPSKIIEYASYGLGIISTRVSDVPLLLDEQSALLLEEDTPECLAGILHQIATGKVDIQSMAKRGQEKINSVANYAIVGKKLKQFLTDGNPYK
jgi:glycosyltransferase involved in cell wall biosynthesis